MAKTLGPTSRTDRTDRERSWPRCPVCGTRRRTFAQLIGHADHKPCTCGGYHYPHRPGSPYCDQRPESGVLRALRDGWEPTAEHLQDTLDEIAFTQPGRPLKVWPF